MKLRSMAKLGMVFAVAALLLIALQGCRKKSQPVPAPPAKEIAPASVEQTICPVMGGAIDKNIFTEYKGKKVYFCCLGCKDTFEKEPEKYLDKLPQFQK